MMHDTRMAIAFAFFILIEVLFFNTINTELIRKSYSFIKHLFGYKSTKNSATQAFRLNCGLLLTGTFLRVFTHFVCLLQLGTAFNLFRTAHATAEDMAFET